MSQPGLDLREASAGLNNHAARDLSVLWRDLGRAVEAETALRDILPGVIDTYGAASATLAANWYDDLREKRGVRGTFRAIPADIRDTGTQSLIGWALSEATDVPAFQALILGGVQRRIANFGRQTITVSSTADPGARGWQREGGGGCDFCAMLIGRGAVYREETADFESHDHCRCIAVPAF